MSRFYAQVTPAGLVVGISQLAAEVNAPGLVEVGEYDADLIGRLWTGSAFIENPNPEPVPEDTGRAVLLAQKALAVRELPDTIKFLDTAERGEASKLFPEWRGDGLAVAVGEVYRYQGAAWRVIQAHNTQPDWSPDAVPALFEAL